MGSFQSKTEQSQTSATADSGGAMDGGAPAAAALAPIATGDSETPLSWDNIPLDIAVELSAYGAEVARLMSSTSRGNVVSFNRHGLFQNEVLTEVGLLEAAKILRASLRFEDYKPARGDTDPDAAGDADSDAAGAAQSNRVKIHRAIETELKRIDDFCVACEAYFKAYTAHYQQHTQARNDGWPTNDELNHQFEDAQAAVLAISSEFTDGTAIHLLHMKVLCLHMDYQLATRGTKNVKAAEWRNLTERFQAIGKAQLDAGRDVIKRYYGGNDMRGNLGIEEAALERVLNPGVGAGVLAFSGGSAGRLGAGSFLLNMNASVHRRAVTCNRASIPGSRVDYLSKNGLSLVDTVRDALSCTFGQKFEFSSARPS
jgi:hypothetical protein